jgi:hypothetical protein
MYNTDGTRTSKYWRSRAQETRTLAASMHDDEAKATLLDIADRYERMARRSEAREAREGWSRPSRTRPPRD